MTHTRKRERSVEEAAREMGYTVFVVTALGHLRCQHPNGAMALVPRSPGRSNRAWANTVGTLRREVRRRENGCVHTEA